MFCSFVFAYEPWKLPAHSTTSCARKRVHASTVVAAEGESILDVANANTHTDDYYADVLGRFSPPRVDSTVLTLEGCVLGLLFLKAANRIKRGISLFGRNGSEVIRMHAAPFSVAFFGQGSCLSNPSQWQY